MTCRQCGTVIAEKALICYKCGTATTEAKYAPVPIAAGAPQRTLVVVVALLVLVGLYGGLMGEAPAIRGVGAVVAGGGVLYLGMRFVRQRRR